MSPFMNTRMIHKASNTRSKNNNNSGYKPIHEILKSSYKWFPVIDSVKWHEKYIISVMDLSKALHGFIIFEVAWKDVRGMSYINELQSDTSLALEVKSMKKWEFNSPDQASRCISLWFSGKTSDIQSLKNNLRKLSDLDIHQWDTHYSSKDILLHQRSPSDILSGDDFLDVQEFPSGIDNEINFVDLCSEDMKHKTIYDFDHNSVRAQGTYEEKKPTDLREMEDESTIAPTQYADTLILFKSSDSILPFKLRQVIMHELRLLTLLEAGLPSWVIFFQSYPLFCYFYRPWMRYLVRTLYILISLVTVIIGFYDLYKNVPLLKVTAARLYGPLFVWIDEWDMVSRIHYLGTMLFLQNLEKGFKWFQMIVQTTGAILSTIAKPFSGPLYEVVNFLSPLWIACSETGQIFSSMVWFVIESLYNVFLDLIDVLIWPFELLYSYIWTIATSVHLLLSSIWDLFLVPIQYALKLANYMASLLSGIFEFLKDVWKFSSSIFQLRTLSEAKQGAYEISIWHGSWNDLFSQVFCATRSIINGLVAFFMTCNRHRLSIYNHGVAFLQRLACVIRFALHAFQCQQMPQVERHHKEDHRECKCCKGTP